MLTSGASSIRPGSGGWRPVTCAGWHRPTGYWATGHRVPPPYYRRSAGGEHNPGDNARDRHTGEGHGGRTPLIYDSPVTGPLEPYPSRRLRDEAALFAGALRGRGGQRGDGVVLYLPM